MQLPGNPSSHRWSRFSLDYLLLPPRSVLMHDRNKITLCILHLLYDLNAPHKPTSKRIMNYTYYHLYVNTLSAPLIFKAIAFVRWVVTHSLADSDFHGHCPDVIIQQHFLWYLIMSVQSGTFKTTFGSSRITYSAYQKMSTNRKKYSKI
jgi:hypothetical protein